jgi:molybdopterin-synthase adenylyltransferase
VVTGLFHESRYRGDELMERIAELRVYVCGAGALGANVAESLARSGFGAIRVIDRDRVEERNLSTQPYQRADIGAMKARILANSLYRAVGTTVDAKAEELGPSSVSKLLGEADLVVDTFDNSASRRTVADHCTRAGTPCLHAGMAAGFAEVIWNEAYRVPSDANDDVCDYPLARNLVLLTVAVACEAIVSFAATGERRSFTITLSDLVVSPFA